MYNKYREFDNRTYELYKVLMQAEKHRQEKLTQAMKVDTDSKTTMQSIAGMCPLLPVGDEQNIVSFHSV